MHAATVDAVPRNYDVDGRWMKSSAWGAGAAKRCSRMPSQPYCSKPRRMVLEAPTNAYSNAQGPCLAPAGAGRGWRDGENAQIQYGASGLAPAKPSLEPSPELRPVRKTDLRRNFLIHGLWRAHYAGQVAGSAPHGCRDGGPVSPAMGPVPTPSPSPVLLWTTERPR